MSKDKEGIVYKKSNGEWVNKKNSASKSSSIHPTQKKAEKAAREMLKKFRIKISHELLSIYGLEFKK